MASLESSSNAPEEEYDEEEVVDDEASYDEEEVEGEEEVVAEEEVEGEDVEEEEIIDDDEEEVEEEVVDDEPSTSVDNGNVLPDDSVQAESDIAFESVTVETEEHTLNDPSRFETTDIESGGDVADVTDAYELPHETSPQADVLPYYPPKDNREPFVDEMDPKPSGCNPCYYWLVCLLICGLLGGGAYVGWFLVNEDQKGEPNLREGGTRAPTQAPTVAATTAFDPFQGDCKLKSVQNPHPLDQCRCIGKIQNIPEDVLDRYEFHLETFIPTIYPEYSDSQDSCTARNQALIWLSSGNGFSFTLEERTERFALATLFAEVMGTSWTEQENWFSEESICTWYGVTCDGEGYLQILALDENKLVGRLPPELALLKRMVQFFVPRNELGGAFPEGLFTISSLELIDVSSNTLTGPIPPSIETATSLKELNLGKNFLSGRITQLIGAVTTLEALSLGGNEFGGTFPLEFFDLVNLTSLDIGGNQFTGPLPSEIGLLTNLTSLSLGPNDFTGELPTSFVELQSLTSLIIKDIPLLTGRLPAIYAQTLTSLTELIITDTGIEGAIETSFGMLSDLERLELSNNNLRGSIPMGISNLSSLTWMDLSRNFLTGSIPDSIGTMSLLTQLIMNDNLLGGGVPDSFNDLTSLEFLRLDGNSLTGRVSDEVCALRQGSLTSLIVDCPATDNGIDVGVTCEIPSCCSGCRAFTSSS